MKETKVELNVQEVGILLTALQLLELSDERRLEREYGSAPALHQKLHDVWEQMDSSETGLRYEAIIEPSF